MLSKTSFMDQLSGIFLLALKYYRGYSLPVKLKLRKEATLRFSRWKFEEIKKTENQFVCFGLEGGKVFLSI